MRHQRLNRLAAMRCKFRLLTRQPDGRSILRRDFAQETLGLTPGEAMFNGMEKGMIVVVDTFAFPIIGEVVAFDDTSVTLKNGVRVLYDGRHGEYAKGAASVPANAEIEATYPLYTISADFIGGWGPYPGHNIPKPQ